MGKQVKKIVTILVMAVLVIGSTVGVFADEATASWSVEGYPGTTGGNAVVVKDLTGHYECCIHCDSYNLYGAAKTVKVTFNSDNFKFGVSIGGEGEVHANKKVIKANNTYTVKYGTDAAGRLTAKGSIEG